MVGHSRDRLSVRVGVASSISVCLGWILVDSLVSLECGGPAYVVEVYGSVEERGREC